MRRVQAHRHVGKRALTNRPREGARGPVPAVSDYWPEDIPVTDAETAVFEAWFGDLFDELFGPSEGITGP